MEILKQIAALHGGMRPQGMDTLVYFLQKVWHFSVQNINLALVVLVITFTAFLGKCQVGQST